MWFKYGLKAQKVRSSTPFQGVWLGASALYLSLRPVTVGSGRVGKTCESSVDNKIKNEEFH